MSKKVMVWCSSEAMELRLTNEINNRYDLVGIVIQERRLYSKLTFARLVKGIINKIFFYYLIDRAWIRTQKWFRDTYNQFPNVPKIYVENINDASTFEFLEEHPCDIIVVSGTALVRKELMSKKPTLGIINLHTGLSPYVKGGPNCTNWCLSRGWYHLIGNTVMWLDEGIDSGNLITTKCMVLDSKWSHKEVLRRVTLEGQNLYLDILEKILNGQRINNVPQHQLGKGTVFYNKQWGFRARFNLIWNFYTGDYRRKISSNNYRLQISRTKTLSIDEEATS